MALGVLYKITFLIDAAAKFRRTVVWAAGASILSLVLLVLMAISSGIVLIVHNFLAELPILRLIPLLFGAAIPILLVWLLSIILTVYSTVKISSLVNHRSGVIL